MFVCASIHVIMYVTVYASIVRYQILIPDPPRYPIPKPSGLVARSLASLGSLATSVQSHQQKWKGHVPRDSVINITQNPVKTTGMSGRSHERSRKNHRKHIKLRKARRPIQSHEKQGANTTGDFVFVLLWIFLIKEDPNTTKFVVFNKRKSTKTTIFLK